MTQGHLAQEQIGLNTSVAFKGTAELQWIIIMNDSDIVNYNSIASKCEIYVKKVTEDW